MKNDFSVAGYWGGDCDEAGLERWARHLRAQLAAPEVSLGLVFLGPRFFEVAGTVLEILRLHARIPLLLGCSGSSLVAGDAEIERRPGVALGLYSLPGARLQPVRFTAEQIESAGGPDYWPQETGVPPGQVNGWLAFLDPFHADAENWTHTWNLAYAPRPVLGGLASGDHQQQHTQLYLNGEVFEDGGVALAVGGGVELRGVISQGCTPIGETWTLTKVEHNLIHEIGNRPAYEVLVETVNNLSAEEQKAARGNLFIGLVVNEYLEEFHRGDFLVRNLLGGDPHTGLLAVGARPRLGQTVQFQRRDARAATEDLELLLTRTRRELAARPIYGGCLCVCNGRGESLFGVSSHDARMVQHHLGPMGLAGFFCNGEIGPVGDQNFLHGYTASLALFVPHTPAKPPAGNETETPG